MGSTASQLLRFLPGAAETAGGVATANPMLATMGAGSLAGAATNPGGSPTPTAPGMPQPNSNGFGNVGNTVASVAAPLLGVGGAMMANRQQPQQAPMAAPPRQGPSPLTANQMPIGQAQTVQPMTALAAYQRLLSGSGNG